MEPEGALKIASSNKDKFYYRNIYITNWRY